MRAARIGIAQRDVVLQTLDGPIAVTAGEVVTIIVSDDVATANDLVKAHEAALSVRRKLRGKK